MINSDVVLVLFWTHCPQAPALCQIKSNQIKFYWSHAPNTTGADITVKCLLTALNQQCIYFKQKK